MFDRVPFAERGVVKVVIKVVVVVDKEVLFIEFERVGKNGNIMRVVKSVMNELSDKVKVVVVVERGFRRRFFKRF